MQYADANAPPQCHRPGIWLEDKYFGTRALLKRSYDRCCVSGKMDGYGHDLYLLVLGDAD